MSVRAALPKVTGTTMTDQNEEPSSIDDNELPDDLPPVQPPSPGFIIQLFVFPALIVMAVVAIWWMFGLIAVGEQDWHNLVQELQSPNLHIRNRAMFGLAQLLEQDTRRGDQGENLRSNREIAQGLTDQLILELRKNSTSKDAVSIQEYLTRAMGTLDSPDITAPALRAAMEPQRDVEIRKSAIVSLSFIAGRAIQRGESVQSPECVESLIQASSDPLAVIRHAATYGLGLYPSPESKHQLDVLLESGDLMTRVNAAIGLARQGYADGYAVLRDALKSKPEADSMSPSEHLVLIKNALKAISELAPKLDSAQRAEVLPLLEELARQHPETRIQLDASSAAMSVKSVAEHR